jgi:acetylornithine aminotransferase
MFAYQHAGITPDVLLLAKALGGGFPMGAVIAARAVADVLTPGTHATTYGGSPLACACGLAVLETIRDQRLLERVATLSPRVFKRLEAWKRRLPVITDVRGKGFMIGIELNRPGREVVERCRRRRVLLNCTQETVLRLLPAMTITREQLDRALGIVEQVLTELSVSAAHDP